MTERHDHDEGLRVIRSEALGGWAVLDAGGRILFTSRTRRRAEAFVAHRIAARRVFCGCGMAGGRGVRSHA